MYWWHGARQPAKSNKLTAPLFKPQGSKRVKKVAAYSQEITVVALDHEQCVLWAQEEKDHPDCCQHKVQKPTSVMLWGCVIACGRGNLYIFDGHINAQRYIQVLE